MHLALIRTLIRSSVAPFQTEDVHLTRFSQYQFLKNLRIGSNCDIRRIASISGSCRLCKTMGFSDSQIIPLDYPNYDARSLPFPDAYFDACVADQVLEHIESNPYEMFSEVSRIVRPDGLFINATIMTYPVHFGPKDMWRFTPDGHQLLFEESGFQVIASGSWGGAEALLLITLGLANLSVPRWSHHPIRRIAENTGEKWPIVIWAVGKKLKCFETQNNARKLNK